MMRTTRMVEAHSMDQVLALSTLHDQAAEKGIPTTHRPHTRPPVLWQVGTAPVVDSAAGALERPPPPGGAAGAMALPQEKELGQGSRCSVAPSSVANVPRRCDVPAPAGEP